MRSTAARTSGTPRRARRRGGLLRFLRYIVKGSGKKTATSLRSEAPTRPTRRPTPRRTTAGTAPRRFQRRPSGRFTGRAAILALVISAIVLTLAYPLREYLAQRARIAEIVRAQDAQEARIADLTRQKRRWEDPAYVSAEARKRFKLVEPGSVLYLIHYEDPADQPVVLPDGQRLPRGGSDAPWYSQLWGSVRAADRPAATLPVDAPVLRGGDEPTPKPRS